MSATPPAPAADAAPTEYAADPAVECDALRNALNAKEQELSTMRARLQHNTDALATAVERLERTVSASIDRFTRRLDRLESGNTKRGGGGVDQNTQPHRKRHKYNPNYD